MKFMNTAFTIMLCVSLAFLVHAGRQVRSMHHDLMDHKNHNSFYV